MVICYAYFLTSYGDKSTGEHNTGHFLCLTRFQKGCGAVDSSLDIILWENGTLFDGDGSSVDDELTTRDSTKKETFFKLDIRHSTINLHTTNCYNI